MTIIRLPEHQDTCGEDPLHPSTLILPIAPRPFSRIRFDPMESQARAIPSSGALHWLEENLRQGAKIEAIAIEGPGDPLCEIDCTIETLRLIGRHYPDIEFSVTTLGLHAEQHAASLAACGVKSVTLLVDAVEKEVADRLYAWIRPGKKTIPLAEATAMLPGQQRVAVEAFRRAGCAVTVRTTVYPGVNDAHIEEIAARMAAAGAQAMILLPYKAAAEGDGPFLQTADQQTMQRLLKSASKHLRVLLAKTKESRIGVDCSSPHGACRSIGALTSKPSKKKPNIAVVSSNGMEIDLHLGQANQVLTYGPREDGLVSLLDTRPVPEPGGGGSRWEELAATLSDCFAILAASAGESPRRILAEHGITALITDGEIEATVDLLYGGGKRGKKGKR